MQIRTAGMVIKEQGVNEDDKYVTLLTRDYGVIQAYVKGARRLKSKFVATTGLLCYSNLELFKNKEQYYLDDAEPINIFYDIRKDIVKLSLASYFCEIIRGLVPSEEKAEDFLRLFLNCLHFLSKGNRSPQFLKAVFELRVMVLAGFQPDLVCCVECGEYEAEGIRFYINQGILMCEQCSAQRTDLQEEHYAVLTVSVLAAMRHIAYSRLEQLFHFKLNEDNLILLGQITETYLIFKMERSFKTLSFWHSVVD